MKEYPVLTKCTLKMLRVKGHDVYILHVNGSGKKVKYIYIETVCK